jgi:hypothetical protein
MQSNISAGKDTSVYIERNCGFQVWGSCQKTLSMRWPMVFKLRRLMDESESRSTIGADRPKYKGARLHGLADQRDILVSEILPGHDWDPYLRELCLNPWLVLEAGLELVEESHILDQVGAGEACRHEHRAGPIRNHGSWAAEGAEKTLSDLVDGLGGILVDRIAVKVDALFLESLEARLLDRNRFQGCNLAEDLLEVANFQEGTGVGATGAEVDKAASGETVLDFADSLAVGHHG